MYKTVIQIETDL